MTSDFPKAGQICRGCEERWAEKDMPPQRLIALPHVTQIYHSQVAVCMYCDGEPIVKFALRNAVKDA